MNDMTDSTITLDETPPRRLARVDEGRWLGGVCAALGRYFDINPLVYRIAFAALAFAGGTGVLLYVAAWLVIPHETREESIAVEALRQRREQPWLLLGVGLLAFGGLLLLSEADFWPGTGSVWLAATIAGAALVWWHVSARDGAGRKRGDPDTDTGTGTGTAAGITPPMPPRSRRPSLFLPVLGSLLAAAGLFGFLAVADIYDVSLPVVLAGGVAIVGAAIAAGAATGRRVGGLVLLGLVLLAGFGVAAASPVSLSAGVGEKVERPVDATEIQRTYEFGLGELTVDLSNVVLPAGVTKVDVDLGVGDVRVTVPEDVGLEIDAHAGIGEVTVLGRSDEGTGAHERVVVPGSTSAAPVLELEADVGLGDLEVRRG